MYFSKLISCMKVLMLIGLFVTLFNISEPAAAAVPKLDQIRVALFINTPKYSEIEPAVTLSAANGMDISVRSRNGAKTWISYPDSITVRGSIDQYSVLMLETSDFNSAKSLHGKLAVLSDDSYILSRNKTGKTVYQVYFGSCANMEEATSAADLAKKDPGVSALVGLAPQIRGPYYLQSGSYATEPEAANQVNLLSQTGLNADLAIQEDGAGKLVYSVWIGGAAAPEQLQILKQQASALLPNLILLPVNTASPYLLRKLDVTPSASAADGIPHYAVGGTEAQALFHPKQGNIALKERSAREYRGDMEISSYNGKLAVINEVPFETYLYSVVSSELAASWPAEALKAQAVAARTYALKQGLKYQIAHVTDTTLDQAYYGQKKEFDAAIRAVDATRDEVIKDQSGQLISPVYSSNSGGVTADPSEVWGNPLAYLRSVPSPDDVAAAGKAIWYKIVKGDGKEGYVHSMYLKKTTKTNAAGAYYYEATETVNVRTAPYVDNTGNPAIGQLASKEQVLVAGQETESNAYSWIRIYSAAYIESSLAASGMKLAQPLQTLEISKRGPSGRATEIKANGQVVKVSYPDAFRSALGGLPSTRFEIAQSGGYTIDGSNGGNTGGSSSASSIYVLGAGQSTPAESKKSGVYVLGGTGAAQLYPQDKAPVKPAATQSSNQFIFKGQGFGHGLGMSQWGAKGYAELGYDYKKILQSYYSGVNITQILSPRLCLGELNRKCREA